MEKRLIIVKWSFLVVKFYKSNSAEPLWPVLLVKIATIFSSDLVSLITLLLLQNKKQATRHFPSLSPKPPYCKGNFGLESFLSSRHGFLERPKVENAVIRIDFTEFWNTKSSKTFSFVRPPLSQLTVRKLDTENQPWKLDWDFFQAIRFLCGQVCEKNTIEIEFHLASNHFSNNHFLISFNIWLRKFYLCIWIQHRKVTFCFIIPTELWYAEQTTSCHGINVSRFSNSTCTQTIGFMSLISVYSNTFTVFYRHSS